MTTVIVLPSLSLGISTIFSTDAGELLNIYAPYVLETAITFEYEVPSVEEFKSRIINISAKYPYLKAVDDNGAILGYAYAGVFKGRRAYDWSVETTVYVKKDMHKKGVGRLLYEALEEELKKITGGEYANMPCRRIPTCPGSCNAMWSGLFKCPYTINSDK